MQAAELAILDWIQAHLRCGLLDTAMSAVSHLADHGEIWILLAVVLLFIKGQRRYGASVACALVLDLIGCNMILKPLIGRVRPFAVNAAVELLTKAPTDAAFPSGHTACSFAAVLALKTAGSPLWKPALVLAALIGFSRLYLYVHWPTDVLGGMLLGAAVGWLGAKLVEVATKRIKGRP
jgi:undecaprenyl-diphosphatase